MSDISTKYELTIKKDESYYVLSERHIGTSKGSIYTEPQEIGFTEDFNQIQGLVNDFKQRLFPHECVEGIIYDYDETDEDITVEWEAISKENEDISISGFVHLNKINDDECVNYYDNNGFEIGTHFPNNPYHENRQYDWHVDWEKLANAIHTDDLFLQYLADFAEEDITIHREDYNLIINGGSDD